MADPVRNSEGAPASEAPDPSASDRGAPPEQSNDSLPLADDQQPDTPPAAEPAGEPEAPVGPAAQPGEDQDAEAAPAEAEPGEDHEAKLEHDLDELSAKAQKADEYLELAQRTKADFENYRKRAAREAAAAQERGIQKLARELLPAVDNLDRALAAAQQATNGDDLVSGIKLVHADVIAALARFGIEPFSPEGEQFDPTSHEAVAQQPSEDAQPGTVVEVYQRGFRAGGNVLRPARVVVAGSDDASEA